MDLGELLGMLVFGFPLAPEMIDPRFPLWLQRVGGLLLTLIITACSLLIGAGIGTVLALGRREPRADARRASWLARLIVGAPRHGSAAFVEAIRSMPIMLLVLLVFYAPYGLVQVRVPGFLLAMLAFALYAGAYVSEILRAGFRSVDPGLREAGRILGLTPTQIFVRIELPICRRTMMPDLINVAVTVFKDTSTLAVVAVPELTYVARQLLMSYPLQYEGALLIVFCLYWAPSALFSWLALRAGQRWARLGKYV